MENGHRMPILKGAILITVEELPKGRIRKFEYMAIMDGDYYDVCSVRRKTGKINLAYGSGTFWADLSDIEKLVKYDENYNIVDIVK